MEKKNSQNPISLHEKSFRELRIREACLYIIKAIFNKPTANINLNVEKIKAFPLKPGERQGCPISPYLLNIVLEVLASALRQLNEVKGIQIRRKKSKYLNLQML